MPSRYEREIEEILSRMEESEPRHGLGDRIRPFQRPPTPRRPLPTLRFPVEVVLILLAVVFALIAAGIAFFNGDATVVSGILGAISLVLFVVALVVGWRDRFRPPTKSQWRGSSYTTVTPIRRGFLGAIATQLRVLRLRMYYRRSQRDNGEK